MSSEQSAGIETVEKQMSQVSIAKILHPPRATTAYLSHLRSLLGLLRKPLTIISSNHLSLRSVHCTLPTPQYPRAQGVSEFTPPVTSRGIHNPGFHLGFHTLPAG